MQKKAVSNKSDTHTNSREAAGSASRKTKIPEVKVIEEVAPELILRINEGTISITQARRLARLPANERKAILIAVEGVEEVHQQAMRLETDEMIDDLCLILFLQTAENRLAQNPAGTSGRRPRPIAFTK